MDYPILPYSPGSQCGRLYDRLKQSPIRNYEIHRDLGILVHTRRISEIRQELKRHGMDLIAIEIAKGVWQYEIPQ